MKPNEVRERMLVWFPTDGKDRLLCRVVSFTDKYATLRVLDASTEAIIANNVGPGEVLHTSAVCFEKVEGS